MRLWMRSPCVRRSGSLATVAILAAATLAAVVAHASSQQLERARAGLPGNVLRRGVAEPHGDGLNVLVIGVDRSSSGDGVQLVRVQPDGPLRMLSVPRDLLLDAHDGGERAATIFHQQGPAALVRAVGRTTGEPVHRVLVIRLTAMRSTIDAFGPVTVHNPTRLETREIAGRTWTFPKGDIPLTGRAAEAYMRARHNEADPTESDADRSRRQQLVLTSLVRSIGPVDVMRHPRRTPRRLLQGVATNLTLGELVDIARAARRGAPKRCQLTGESRAVRANDAALPWRARRDGLFLVPDPDEISRTIATWKRASPRRCGI